jgi:hypothetical protein
MALDFEAPLDTAQAVRAAFDDLDLRQLAILARLSPTRGKCDKTHNHIVSARRKVV